MAISIHAPHTGRDKPSEYIYTLRRLISIHAPHTGRDPLSRFSSDTPANFNPRAPYGARLKNYERS